jgi:hypothetical protein
MRVKGVVDSRLSYWPNSIKVGHGNVKSSVVQKYSCTKS